MNITLLNYILSFFGCYNFWWYSSIYVSCFFTDYFLHFIGFFAFILFFCGTRLNPVHDKVTPLVPSCWILGSLLQSCVSRWPGLSMLLNSISMPLLWWPRLGKMHPQITSLLVFHLSIQPGYFLPKQYNSWAVIWGHFFRQDSASWMHEVLAFVVTVPSLLFMWCWVHLSTAPTQRDPESSSHRK